MIFSFLETRKTLIHVFDASLLVFMTIDLLAFFVFMIVLSNRAFSFTGFSKAYYWGVSGGGEVTVIIPISNFSYISLRFFALVPIFTNNR
jgi:hypothetical protein